ncbi:MAG: tetratricopeptide repeat protein, partial [Candidatus Latescibacteria bacterium]|nr:tetratricopeptide repeat protein [Candidatus Latescibacterota bacterium]
MLLNCSRGTLDPGAWKVAITHKNLGLAYLERDDYEHATREFEIVCTTVPDEPLGYANLALAYLNRNLLDQAEQAAKQAIDRADDDAAVRAILADVYTAQGKDDRAIQTLDEALEHDPSAVRVRYRFLKLGQRLRGPGQGEDEA